MSLASAFLVSSAVAILAATGLMTAASLRIASLAETLLVSYVVAWAWLVASITALSIVDGVSTSTWWVALAVGFGVSSAAWWRFQMGVASASSARPSAVNAKRRLR